MTCLVTSSLCRMDCCTPRASHGVWTDSRSDKCRPFVQNGLTHFIDDQAEALVSIGVPAGSGETQDLHRHCSVCPRHGPIGKFSDFGWACSDAARTSAGWSEAWSIYPQSTVPPFPLPGRPVPLGLGDRGRAASFRGGSGRTKKVGVSACASLVFKKAIV